MFPFSFACVFTSIRLCLWPNSNVSVCVVRLEHVVDIAWQQNLSRIVRATSAAYRTHCTLNGKHTRSERASEKWKQQTRIQCQFDYAARSLRLRWVGWKATHINKQYCAMDAAHLRTRVLPDASVKRTAVQCEHMGHLRVSPTVSAIFQWECCDGIEFTVITVELWRISVFRKPKNGDFFV